MSINVTLTLRHTRRVPCRSEPGMQRIERGSRALVERKLPEPAEHPLYWRQLRLQESRMTNSKPIIALVVAILSSSAFLASDTPPPRPAPKPDKALVYYLRTGRYGGSAGSIYLFADRTFVGVIPNGTYGYAYLDPGRRLFWTTW